MSNIDLLTDCRIPEELQRQLQGCSFEAEILHIIGFVPNDGSCGGTRFAQLYDQAELLAREALTFLHGESPAELVIAGQNRIKSIPLDEEEDIDKTFLVFLGGAIVGVFCCAAGCVALLL